MNDEQLTPTGELPEAPKPEEKVVEAAQEEAHAGVMPNETEAVAEVPAKSEIDAAPVAVAEVVELQPEPEPAPEPVVAEAVPEPVAVEPTPEPTVAEAAPEPVAVEPTPVPVVAAPAPKSSNDDMGLFEAEMARLDKSTDSKENYKKLTKGDRIEATVIQVEADRVFVDLGTKSEGVVPLSELTEENLETAIGHVAPGDKIHVVVLRPESAEGNPIVSKKRAEFEETWNKIIQAFEDGRMMTAQVVDRVKGGLLVDIGVRGFVPATHVGNGKIRNLEKYVGQAMQLKIIEIDRDRKKVVLSNRQAEEERRDQVRDEIFTKVAPGDILEGTVRRLTDYGAFVDLGGIDGLLHISEMSWMRINHPREVLKEGQKINVMVLRLDPGNSKISLGLRQVLPDPWNLIRENYKIGQKMQVVISRLVQSGAFVKLPEGAEAFLPVSEISTRRINKPSDVLEEGQEVEATIIDLRPDERRMVLSLRGGSTVIEPPARSGGEYGHDDDDLRGRKPGGLAGKKSGKKPQRGGGRGRDHDDEFDVPITGRIPTGGATIGERLGMLKGFLRTTDEEDDAEETTPEASEPTVEEETKDEG